MGVCTWHSLISSPLFVVTKRALSGPICGQRALNPWCHCGGIGACFTVYSAPAGNCTYFHKGVVFGKKADSELCGAEGRQLQFLRSRWRFKAFEGVRGRWRGRVPSVFYRVLHRSGEAWLSQALGVDGARAGCKGCTAMPGPQWGQGLWGQCAEF